MIDKVSSSIETPPMSPGWNGVESGKCLRRGEAFLGECGRPLGSQQKCFAPALCLCKLLTLVFCPAIFKRYKIVGVEFS